MTIEQYRFYVISERYGLLGVFHTQEEADAYGLTAAINSARTVHIHDRLTEIPGVPVPR